MFLNADCSFSLFYLIFFLAQDLIAFVFPEVILGHAYDEVAEAAKEDLTSVTDELKRNQTKRWQAVGMLKHILAPATLPWELKKHAINFLLCITDGDISHYDEHDDFSSYMPSLFTALQVGSLPSLYVVGPPYL